MSKKKITSSEREIIASGKSVMRPSKDIVDEYLRLVGILKNPQYPTMLKLEASTTLLFASWIFGCVPEPPSARLQRHNEALKKYHEKAH